MTAHIGIHASSRSRQRLQKAVVLLRTGEHRDMGMIFGSGANHRGSANIDVLNGGVPAHIVGCDGFPERVKVHHHYIDGIDLLFEEIRLMGRISPSRQDPAMDSRVEGFNATAKNLWSTGVVCHSCDGQSSLFKHFGCSTTGQQLITMEPIESLSEGHHPAFIGHAQQGSWSHGSRTKDRA